MNKCSKLYNSIHDSILLKVRKCAESVQTITQYQSFKSWSEEIIAYLSFKFNKLKVHWTYRLMYEQKVERFIRDCQIIALNRVNSRTTSIVLGKS